MKIRILQERELILAIRKEFSRFSKDLVLGIGDDAAVIKAGRKYLLLTKDLLVEDFHFILGLHPPYFLGRKSLSVNLSDIAAMGGVQDMLFSGWDFLPGRRQAGWKNIFLDSSLFARNGVWFLSAEMSRNQKR